MNLNVRQCHSDPAVNNVELVVEQHSETEIAVRAGSFTVASQQYVLAEDQIYELVDDPSVRVWITGHLVRDSASDEVALLVDEVYDDGEDVAYRFVQGGDLQLLHTMFVFEIPTHGGTLTDIEVTVFRILDRHVGEAGNGEGD